VAKLANVKLDYAEESVVPALVELLEEAGAID